MLKILVMIECDCCHHSYEQVSCSQQFREKILDDIDDMQINAEEDGWSLFRNSTEHVCPGCNNPTAAKEFDGLEIPF